MGARAWSARYRRPFPETAAHPLSACDFLLLGPGPDPPPAPEGIRHMERIDAGLLIPGRGEPVRDGVVVLDGPQISYAGPGGGRAGDARPARAAARRPCCRACGTATGTSSGGRDFDAGQVPQEPLALRAARSAARPAERPGRRRHIGAGGRRAGRLPGPGGRRGHPRRPVGLRRGRDPVAPPAATATCTAIRCRGWPTWPAATGPCGWPTAPPSACARSGSSCAGVRG